MTRRLGEPSPKTYSTYAVERGIRMTPYDNSQGSALLALSRAGMLRTRKARKHAEPGLETTCVKCGTAPETISHVICECNDIYFEEEEILKRLGLDENPSSEMTSYTKRLLQQWENETSHIR